MTKQSRAANHRPEARVKPDSKPLQSIPKSEGYYSALLQGLADAVFVSSGRITWCNERVEELLGYTPQELVGKDAEFFKPGDVSPSEWARTVYQTTKHRNTYRGITGVTKKDRSPVDVEFATTRVPGKKPAEFVTVARDVTDRVAAVQALHESEARFKAITDNVLDVILVLNKDGTIRYKSSTFEQLVGAGHKGRSPFEFVHPDDFESSTQFLESLLENPGSTVHAEVRGKHSDGSWRTFQVIASNLMDNPAVAGIVVTFRDVTEARRLDYEKARAEALEQSEERLRHLVDNMNDGFCVIQGSTVAFANATSLKMFGYASEEVVGKDIGQLLPKKISEQFAAVRTKRRKGVEAPQQYETVIVDREGVPHPVELSVRNIQFEGKEALSVVLRDISDRKRIEDALRKKEEHFRALIENALDAVVIIDANGTLSYESPSFARMLGFEPGDQTGQSAFTLLHPDDMVTATQAFTGLLDSRESSIHAEVRAQHKDGTWRHLEVVGRNLIDNPAVAGIVANVRDVTDRRAAGEALRQREEYFRALIENSHDGIAIVDSRGIVVYESPSVERLTGYTADVLLGKPIADFMHPDDVEAAREIAQIIQTPGNSCAFESRFGHKDGSWRDMEAVATNLLHDPRVHGVVVNYRDVTERKMAEEELRIKSSALDNSINALAMSDMAGNITYLNDACMRLWGDGDKVDILGKPYWRLLRMDNNASIAEQIAADVLDKGSWEGEVLARNKDGAEMRVQVFTGLVRDQWNEPIQTISWFLDVTERKLSEQALRESERKFRNLVEEMNDGYCVIVGVTVAFANAKCAEIFGYSRDEVTGKSIQELLPARVLRDLSLMRQRRKRGESVPSQYETLVVDKNNRDRTVELSTRLITYDGSPALSIVLRDVTDRKLAEEAVREAERRYRAIFDNRLHMVYVHDEHGHIIEASDSALERLEYKRDDLGSISFGDILHPDDVPKVYESTSQTISRGHMDGPIELRLYSKTGQTIWVETFTTLLPDAEGRVRSLGIAHDITERKQMEQAVRESEERYRLLAENATDVIWTMDLEFAYQYISPSVTYHTGYTPEEFASLRLEEVLAPESVEAAREALIEALQREMGSERSRFASWTLELEVITKRGGTIWVEVSNSFLRGPDGAIVGLFGVARDITDRKRAEEDKHHMEEQLQLTARLASVGELAAGVAHELNNPLAAVQAYAQFVTSRQDLDDALRADIATIYREAQRASRITGNLLSFARKHNPQKSYICINDVIEESLALHAYRMNVNNIEVVTHLDPDLPFTMADFHQMQQVFVNLIVNAEQAMTEAHGKGKLAVRTRKRADAIQATFTDTGPGISPEGLTKVFDPFFTTKSVGKGTGLGLSICYGIVQAHRGQLYVRSRPGEGATFVVEVPVTAEYQPDESEQNESVEAA